MKTLHVISVVSNPLNWNSRADLFCQFIQDTLASKVALEGSEYNLELHIVECLYADQLSCISESLQKSVDYHAVHSSSVIWNKENLINIGISKLPADWKYVAWVDGDITFQNQTWIQDTINVLDRSSVCQLWTEAWDLHANGEVMMQHRSFCSQVDTAKLCAKTKMYTTWHSGYAWGATREAVEALGGLYDKGILGSADSYMAWALIGRLDLIVSNRRISQSELQYLMTWQKRAQLFRNRLGSVPGAIEHYYHGPKHSRGYGWRWKIAADNDFNPDTDVQYNTDGVIEFTDAKPSLSVGVLEYFLSRNEDTVEAADTFVPGEWHE